MARTRAEQETILRWDEEDQRVDIYTSSNLVAYRLRRRGYAMEEIVQGGKVTGYRWLAPRGCLTFRSLVGGELPRPKKGSTMPRFGRQSPSAPVPDDETL